MAHDDAHWVAYNAARGDRPPRDLLIRATAATGPGRGRTAIDLGCGSGVETRALLEDGWRVHAIDGAPGTEEIVAAGGAHDRLTVTNLHYAELTTLPPAELIYSGYALPYQPRESFDRIWALIRGALQPGGVLAVNLFGDRDEWAGAEGETFLTVAEARDLFSGLDLLAWDEEDAAGPAYGGEKHWHVFHAIAKRP